MSLSEFLRRLEKKANEARALPDKTFAPALKASQNALEALVRAEDRMHVRERTRTHQPPKEVSTARIRDLCLAGRASELDREETREILAHFQSFEPAVIRAAVDAFPRLRRGLARRMIRHWCSNVTGDEWDSLVDAASPSEDDVRLTGLELDPKDLLRSTAAHRLARAHADEEIQTLIERLTVAGLSTRDNLLLWTVLEWLQKRRTKRKSFSRTLEWIIQAPEIGGQLLPAQGTQGQDRVRDIHHQARFTAEMLEANEARLITSDKFDALEKLLVSPSCEYGDPRTPRASAVWPLVQAQAPRGFGALQERLNADALKFFFDKSMDDARDRREFWLRYIKSIRHTECVLDEYTYRRIAREVALLEPRLQLAFRRAHRFKGNKPTSAFLMWFDSVVVVEFSQTGNAAYIFDTIQCDSRIRPKLGRFHDEQDLKNAAPRLDKWSHTPAWEWRFVDRLSEYGIRPDPDIRS